MANTNQGNIILHKAEHTTINYHFLTAQQEQYEKAYLFVKYIEDLLEEECQENGPLVDKRQDRNNNRIR